MNGFIRFMIIAAMIASLISCSSQPVEEDLTLEGAEAGAVTEDTLPEDSSTAANEDFSDFDEQPEKTKEQAVAQQEAVQADDELSIEDELSKAGGENLEQAQTPPPAVEEPALEPPPMEPALEPAPEMDALAQAPPPAVEPEPIPEPVPVAPEVAVETPAPAPMQEAAPATTRITNLKFKANDAGGTVIVEANQPLNYTTRANPDLGQYIIEIENVNLPDRLKRSLNTRDIKGNFGAIDAYQNPGSTTARFVVQLRQGAEEPTVQPEGNSLLIMASSQVAKAAPTSKDEDGAVDEGGADTVAQAPGILSSQNLAEFLAGNTNFYGKKISIETNNMDIRDALNFITEESGVNMVVAEEVKGNVSLKLRQVPWDQALVVIMKAKRLGYTRQGNVLRIAPLTDLKAEEDDATKLAISKRTVEPLKVRMFSVSYAKVEELEKKVKDFLGERGKVIGDGRTNSLVVTDIEDNVERVAKLIASLDTQPPQVLIEGKIVEARERFTRQIGVNWSASGAPKQIGTSPRGPVNLTPRISTNNGGVNGNLNIGLTLGTLDILGTLTASLSLAELDESVKVISSPRIVTLTNEKANINQVTEVPVKQVTINGTTVQTTFQFKPLSLKLEVTPQVTADGSVIMAVVVNRQFQGATVDIESGAFSVNSREAQTKVLVKNGQTAVIGGIYQSDAQDASSGTPWFKDIPGLGYLFKSETSNKEKSELLIFLTPRILGQLESGTHAPTPEM